MSQEKDIQQFIEDLHVFSGNWSNFMVKHKCIEMLKKNKQENANYLVGILVSKLIDPKKNMKIKWASFTLLDAAVSDIGFPYIEVVEHEMREYQSDLLKFFGNSKKLSVENHLANWRKVDEFDSELINKMFSTVNESSIFAAEWEAQQMKVEDESTGKLNMFDKFKSQDLPTSLKDVIFFNDVDDTSFNRDYRAHSFDGCDDDVDDECKKNTMLNSGMSHPVQTYRDCFRKHLSFFGSPPSAAQPIDFSSLIDQVTRSPPSSHSCYPPTPLFRSSDSGSRSTKPPPRNFPVSQTPSNSSHPLLINELGMALEDSYSPDRDEPDLSSSRSKSGRSGSAEEQAELINYLCRMSKGQEASKLQTGDRKWFDMKRNKQRLAKFEKNWGSSAGGGSHASSSGSGSGSGVYRAGARCDSPAVKKQTGVQFYNKQKQLQQRERERQQLMSRISEDKEWEEDEEESETKEGEKRPVESNTEKEDVSFDSLVSGGWPRSAEEMEEQWRKYCLEQLG